MNKDLEKVYKRNIYELQKQNKTLMIRVKELTEENYKLKTDQSKKLLVNLFKPFFKVVWGSLASGCDLISTSGQ